MMCRLLLALLWGAAHANLPDPRHECKIRQTTTPRLSFRPNWSWDHIRCPLPPRGVVPSATGVSLGGEAARPTTQLMMRQLTTNGDGTKGPVGTRTWKMNEDEPFTNDCSECPGASSCLAARPADLMCLQG